MASKVTFDSVNKLIICKAGVTELDAKTDIYSDTKEDWQTDTALNKFRFIFRAIGGDETLVGEIAPLYAFINYGWRIRPDEADHTLNIVNGAILVEGDTAADPFVDTLGDFTVRIRMYVPVKATIVSSGSGVTEQDKLDIADAVHDEDLTGHNAVKSAGATLQANRFGGKIIIDTVSGVAGTAWDIGTHENPSNNLTDALTIMAARHLDQIMLHSDLTITAAHDVSNIVIETAGRMGTTVTFETGCSADGTAVRYANVEGVLTNGDVLLLESCSIGDLSNFTGVMNVVNFGDGAEVSIGIWASIIQATGAGSPTNEPEINIGTAALGMSHYAGNLKLTNKTGTNSTVINSSSGNFIIDSTCIAGRIQILGSGQIEADNSGAGCQVDIDSLIISVKEDVEAIHKMTHNKATVSGDTLTIYEDDNITVWKTFDLSNEGRVEL